MNMASLLGTNRRKAEAQERIESTIPELADRFGIDVPPIPVFRRDPNRESAERAEWIADVLDVIGNTSLTAKPATKAKGN